MAMKVYINGDTVEIDQTGQPLLNISRNKAIYRIENDDVTIFNNGGGKEFKLREGKFITKHLATSDRHYAHS